MWYENLDNPLCSKVMPVVYQTQALSMWIVQSPWPNIVNLVTAAVVVFYSKLNLKF
jgi:hypothetical protein